MTLLDAQALVVGIADYRSIRPLPRVRDATEIARVLADPGLGGYDPAGIELLTDAQATGTALRSALARLAGRCHSESTALIYFSGHGGRIADGPHAGSYLLPVDVAYPGAAELAATAISGAEFTAALAAIPARRRLVILDCCHAGGIGAVGRDLSGLDPEPALRPGLAESDLDRLRAGRGQVILAAARPEESSYVLDGASFGLFTEHLLGGLQGGVASEDGLVRIFDLFEYLQPRVTRVRPDQHPVFKAELEDNFPVARYRGGARGAVARVDERFRFDAYISYVDVEPDASYVWDTLVPRLEAAGLRVAVSNDSEDPGVARVVGVERAIRESKRTVLVLSEAYRTDHLADFQNVLGQTLGIEEGTARLLPVRIGPIAGALPTRLSMLTTLDLSQPARADREFRRLVAALQGPLPRPG